MNFDDYWKNLIIRVYRNKEKLEGNEEIFCRLSCIYGETIVDGIEAYFERRFDDFEADMNTLREANFSDLASEFEAARKILFGTEPLNRENIEKIISTILKNTEATQSISSEINKIYDRIIPQLEKVADYKHSFGLKSGLFEGN